MYFGLKRHEKIKNYFRFYLASFNEKILVFFNLHSWIYSKMEEIYYCDFLFYLKLFQSFYSYKTYFQKYISNDQIFLKTKLRILYRHDLLYIKIIKYFNLLVVNLHSAFLFSLITLWLLCKMT